MDLKGKRILIVEDEASIAELLKIALTSEGCEISLANNGDKAREIIEKNGYDLYVFDIRLPGLSGDELYNWMAENRPETIGRVVFTTGSVIGQDTKVFLDRVGRPTIFKPFTLSELRQFIKDSLEKAEQQKS